MEYLNIIVKNEYYLPQDKKSFFGPHEHVCKGCMYCRDEEVIEIDPEEKDMYDLLVMLGSFSSRSQAKKNWKQSEILPGYSEYYIGKLKRRLCILNPIKE